jgi:hypothetical protein
MKKSFVPFQLISFLVIILSASSCNRSSKKADLLLGTWYVVKGELDAYSFMKDNKTYIFTGTEDQRPVAYGKWKADGENFIFTMDDGTVKTSTYTLAKDTLFFDSSEEIYTRTLPLEIRFPEAMILKELASDFSSHRFSKPMSVDFSWGKWDDSTHSSIILQAKGYGIIMASRILSDDLENISGYLADHGFLQDTLFVSETCTGFWNDNQLVTVCKKEAPESQGDSINIFVSSAIIK